MSLHEKNKIKPSYDDLKVDASGNKLPEAIISNTKTILLPVRLTPKEHGKLKDYCSDKEFTMTSLKGLQYLIKILKKR